MSFQVYILKSQTTGKYYCGQTNNIEDRLLRHNSGRNKYTKRGMPWDCIAIYMCDTRSEAMALENKIKNRGIERYLIDNSTQG